MESALRSRHGDEKCNIWSDGFCHALTSAMTYSQTHRALSMKLILQPEAGVAPLVTAIDRAKKIVHILIFRFDLDELEEALERALERGVIVMALVAQPNSGGEQGLQKLELRMLKSGVTVSRTEDDFVRSAGSPSDDTPTPTVRPRNASPMNSWPRPDRPRRRSASSKIRACSRHTAGSARSCVSSYEAANHEQEHQRQSGTVQSGRARAPR